MMKMMMRITPASTSRESVTARNTTTGTPFLRGRARRGEGTIELLVPFWICRRNERYGRLRVPRRRRRRNDERGKHEKKKERKNANRK